MNDLLGLVAAAASPEIALERFGDGKSCRNELRMLAPFEAKLLLDARVAIHPALPLNQEVADLLRDGAAVLLLRCRFAGRNLDAMGP